MGDAQEILCHRCGAALGEAGSCSSCGARVDSEIARWLAAARRLEERVGDDDALDPELKSVVGFAIRQRVARLLELATAAEAKLAAAEHAASKASEVAAPSPSVPPPPPEATTEAPPEPAKPPPLPASVTREPWWKRRERERRQSLWARLGPLFAENILFTLAVFLIVGGAVFFVTTAWTTMTGAERLLVVFGGVELLGGLLYLTGRGLNRRGAFPDVERTLSTVIGFLAPIAGLVAGRLLAASAPLGLAAAAIALASGWFAASKAARQQQPELHPPLTATVAGFTALALFAPWLSGSLELTAVGAAALAIVAWRRVAARALAVAPRRAASIWIALTLMAFAAVTAVGGAALDSEVSNAVRMSGLGALLAVFGLLTASTENGLAAAGRLPTGRSPAALIAAIALSLTGCVIATADMRMLLVACVATTCTAIGGAFRLGRPALLWPGLAISAVAYFLSPAPVRELALSIRDQIADSLGYPPERLPLSFYGITFLPYLAALAIAAAWLRRRGWEGYSTVVLSWTIAVAGGLAMLSVVAGSDARAPMAVLGAEGSMLIALGAVTRRKRLIFAGVLGLFGSLVTALVHAGASHPQSVLALAAGGFLAVATAAGLQRGTGPGSFRVGAAHAVLDAAAIGALSTAAFALLPLDVRFAAVGTADGWAYALLASLVAVLAHAYRLGWLGTLAWALAGFGLLGFLGGEHSAALEPATALWFALASAAPLAFARWVRVRPGLARPHPIAPLRATPAPTVAAVLSLLAFAVPAVVSAIDGPSALPWTIAASITVAAGSMFAAALSSGYALLALFGSAGVLGGALAWVDVLGYAIDGFVGAAGLAIGAAILAGIHAASRSGRLARLEPAAVGAVGGAAVALAWSVVLRLENGFGWIPPASAWPFLIAVAAVLGTGALAYASLRGRELRAWPGYVGSAAAVLLPIAICDTFRPEAAVYALASVAACGIARPLGPRLPLAHLSTALIFAVVLAAKDVAGDWLLACTFAAIGAAARFALAPGSPTRSYGVLVGALGALWFGLANLPLDARWVPAVVLAFAAAATFAPGVRALGVERRGTGWFVKPLAALALVVFGSNAIGVLLAGATVFDGDGGRAPWHAAAAALLGLGLALGCHARGARRQVWPVVFAALAAFASAPLNLLIEGHRGGTAWPDVEVAAIGLCAAVLFGGGRASRVAMSSRAVIAYAVAVSALPLTGLAILDPSTPWTFAIVAAVPCALLLRERRPAHADALGAGLVLAAFAETLFLASPPTGPTIGVVPWLAAVSAASALAFFAAERALGGRAPGSFAKELAPRFGRLSTIIGVAGLAFVAADAVARAGVAADGATVACAVTATAVAAALGLRRAFALESSGLVHVAVAAGLVLYAFLANRTGYLDAFDGRHLHVLSIAGAGLLFAARVAPRVLASPFLLDGLLLPIPAILIEGPRPSVDGAFALVLGSIIYGYGSMVLRTRVLTWLAASLLNGALFSLWMHHGVVDPAFYGVPAGLTLVIGSEVARRGAARFVLWTSGLVVLYGSIAVQVLRVEEPAHAVMLFAGGLAAVGLGFLARRHDYLIAGAAAVVIDVVAYLARHGLERDFTGAALLVASGLTVLFVAVAARRRREEQQA